MLKDRMHLISWFWQIKKNNKVESKNLKYRINKSDFSDFRFLI